MIGNPSPLRLRFNDTDLEARWRQYNFERSLGQVRIVLIVAAVVLFAYHLADRIILPPELTEINLFAPRAIMTAAVLMVFFLSFSSPFRRIWQGCLVAAISTVVAGLSWMWLIIEASSPVFHASIYWYYHNGLVLIAMYSFLLLRLTVTSALAVAGIQAAIFIVMASLRPEPEINLVAGLSILFVLTFGLFAVFGLESTERRVFRQRALIDRQRKELGTSLERLAAEKRKTDEQAERLYELDVAKNRFFQNISHEFRTPLTLIVGPLQDAIEGGFDSDPEALRRQLRVMLRSSRRLLQLVNQMLDLSKLEAGKLKLKKRPGDLVSLVRSTACSFMPLAERRGINYRFASDLEMLPCLFDADKIEKIVSNLVSNALKLTPHDGEVTVRLSSEPASSTTTARITVTDTGPGIATEHIDRIFDRFHRDDISTNGRSEGTGIGLSLARELAELHDGSIRVESNLGSGSTFEVSIPVELVPEELVADMRARILREVEPIELPESITQSTDSTSGECATILVVEDNPEVRDHIRSQLCCSYRIIEASDGTTGLAAAEEHHPDLILSDVIMPGMDGNEMVRKLRQIESLQDIPVIMLSAKAGETDVVEGMESGADEYITKPFGSRELRARVASLLSSRKQLHDHFSKEIVVKGKDIAVNSDEALFLQTVSSIVDARLDDPNFGVDWLADEIGLSRRQLERRLGTILEETPAMLIRRFRLERASQLLRAGSGTVAEIAYAVGFNSPDYFAKVFRNEYGETPSEHATQELDVSSSTRLT